MNLLTSRRPPASAMPATTSESSRPRAAESKTRFRLDDLPLHFKQRIREEIDRTGRWCRIDDKIAAFCQFETIGRVMTKIVVGQLRIFPSLANVNRDPAVIGQEF